MHAGDADDAPVHCFEQSGQMRDFQPVTQFDPLKAQLAGFMRDLFTFPMAVAVPACGEGEHKALRLEFHQHLKVGVGAFHLDAMMTRTGGNEDIR